MEGEGEAVGESDGDGELLGRSLGFVLGLGEGKVKVIRPVTL